MKKLLLLIVILFAIFNVFAEQTITYLVKEDQSETEFSGKNYKSIKLNSNEFYLNRKAGNPALPTKSLNFVVDNGSKFLDVKYTYDLDLIQANIMIEPAQKFAATEQNFPVPAKVGPNAAIYQSNNIFPKEIIKYNSTQKMSAYTIFTFEYSPLVFNPVEKKLYKVRNLKLEIKYDLSDYRSLKGWDNGVFYSMLKDNVENDSNLTKMFRRKRNSDVEYLIITSNQLKNNFQIFADWKNETGTSAEVVTIEEINSQYSGATEQIRIKNAIKDYYENKGTVYVLLGGDNTVVIDQDCYGDVNDGDTTDDYMPTDLFYACFDDQFDWNADGDNLVGEVEDDIDMAPEVIISRAPVRTTNDVNSFINKTKNYLYNPTIENFAKEMCTSGLQLWSTWDGKSDAHWRAEKMWEDQVAPYWDGEKTIYYDTGTDFAGGASYDVTSSHTMEVLNMGFNFFFMGTHGNQQIWSMEAGDNFDSYEAASLNNLNAQGLVVTMACITNAFDGSSGYTLDPSLSEAFLRNTNGGAVAYHGCSRFGWGYSNQSANPGPSMDYSGTLFNKIFTSTPENGATQYGALATATKIDFLAASSDYGAFRWIQFGLNTIGDPQVDFYTEEPALVDADYPEVISLGTFNDITISTNVPFSRVSLQSESISISGIANENGDFSCLISPSELGEIQLSIIGHNHIGYTSQIEVIPGEIPYVTIDSYEINTSDGDNIIEFGESVNIDLTFKNAGAVDAQNSAFSVSCSNSNITINNFENEIVSLAAGESIFVENAINITVSQNIINDEEFVLQNVITENNEEWQSELVLKGFSPVIEMSDIEIDDGGDGVLEPGEEATLGINITNSGGADINNIMAELIASNENISIENISTEINSLAPEEEGYLEYEISISEAMELDTFCSFILDVNADNFSKNVNFALHIGQIMEDFETGDFSLMDWNFSGNGAWQVAQEDPYEGSYCIKNEDIDDNESSTITLNVNVLTAGQMSFFKKVSSELDYDYLKFYIDGEIAGEWSGNISWSEEAFFLSTGDHLLEWTYQKDSYVSNGSDCAWIDQITFPAIAPSNNIPQVIEYSPIENEINLMVGESLQFSVEIEDEDELSFDWSVNSVEQRNDTSEFDYEFTEIGEYEVIVNISDGIYEIMQTWTVVVDPVSGDDDNVKKYELAQNYPNPFTNNSESRNYGTTINYAMKNRGKVSINIYNIKGQLVKNLVDEVKEIGRYSVNWNGKNKDKEVISSGIYFYKMETKDYTKFRKILLIK